MEMGEWYVKYRRPMLLKDLRAIGTKHFGSGDEYTEFLEHFVTPEGIKEFRRELRQIMRTHGVSIPPEEEWLPLTELRSTTGKKYVEVLSPGQTIFNIYDLVSEEEFNRENERVKKLGENPATGEIWEEGKPKRLPAATRKELAAFMEIADWFVKYRRAITVKEMRPLATKYFPTEKEFVEFLEYLKSSEGQKEFRRVLRDAMRRHGISMPPEEEYITSVRELASRYSTQTMPETSEKLLPALKPFDPYKFAEYVLRNNVFSDKDTSVYSGLSGTNPHRVPDHIWAEVLADIQGEFVKTGDLYVVHTPGVERPPTMRAAPTWREPLGELSLGTIELLAETEGDPLRKFCCRQCGDCAPKELLGEGKFPDRIAWLRHHYKEKHPGMWGKVSAATTPEEIPRRLSLEQVSGLETRFPIEKLWADERAYLDKLTTEIEREGLTEPITIRVRDDGSLIVWDGMHRLAVAQKLRIKDIPVEFIGNISAFPKGLLSKQPAVIPTGKCYEDAWRFLLKEQEGELIHGSVQTVGKRINHAWVELPTGFIWEPESEEFMKTAYFYERAQPQVEARYTAEEAAIMATRTGNHGPWTADERGRFLRKSPAVIPKAQPRRLPQTEQEWVYVKVGNTEMRGRNIPSGMEFEQVSPNYDQDDLDKAVKIIEEKLKATLRRLPQTEPSPPSPKEELEFVADSAELLAYTIEDIGYREKLDKAFEEAIARVKGE